MSSSAATSTVSLVWERKMGRSARMQRWGGTGCSGGLEAALNRERKKGGVRRTGWRAGERGSRVVVGSTICTILIRPSIAPTLCVKRGAPARTSAKPVGRGWVCRLISREMAWRRATRKESGRQTTWLGRRLRGRMRRRRCRVQPAGSRRGGSGASWVSDGGKGSSERGLDAGSSTDA